MANIDNSSSTLSRRSFLKKSAGFTFAIGATGVIAPMMSQDVGAVTSDESLQPNIWVTINPDNTIVAKYAGTEFGQGSMTHVPMMLADYLDADWDTVKVEIVTVHDTAYGNPIFQNWLYTAGSTQIAIYKKKMAMAGTQARKMLMMAVANKWNVDLSELTTEPSMVVHAASGRQISYGDIVATLELPAEPPAVEESEFKSPDKYRYIGKSLGRRDVPAKSNGSIKYAIDLDIPGMAYAMVKRTPVEGERPIAVDDSKSRTIKGVIDIVTLPYGVAIVAETVEAAQKAKSVLNVTWSEESPFRQRSSSAMIQEYAKNAQDLSISGTPWIMAKGDVNEAFSKSDKVYDAVYTSDAAYHGQIEPLNAIASVSDDGKSAEIWVGTQSQSTTIIGSAETLDTTIDKIKLHPITMGGGFGRRGLVHADFTDDALLISKAMKRPIKVIWSREDDVEAGTFRTPAAQYIKGAFDEDGKLTAIHHRVGVPDILPNMNMHRWNVVKPKDVIAVMGSENRVYDIPNHLPEHVKQERASRVNAWRGIATSYTKFAMESFLDELAHEREIDPLEFRLQLSHNNPRLTRLFNEVAEMSEWKRPRPEGVGLGIAFADYHHSLSVGVIELSVDENTGIIDIKKFWAVGDAGHLVSPLNAQAQVEANIIWGFSQALKERITIENGVVQQSNYHNYPIMRINEVPDFECRLIETDNHSTGVGELALSTVAPAIGNAIFSITGKRVRHMPMTPDVVKAALST